MTTDPLWVFENHEEAAILIDKLRAELERRAPDALLSEARMVISSMLDECEHDFPLELKWMAERASKGRRIYEDNRALASAPSVTATVPDGWQLVPIEPTPEMRLAGKRTIKGAAGFSEGEQAVCAYKQMLAAARKGASQ